MPDSFSNNVGAGTLVGTFPLQTINSTSTYSINGGASLAAGASVTETISFSGLVLTDNLWAIRNRDGLYAIPKGIQLLSAVQTATGVITVTWKNTTLVAITPPAVQTWYCVIYGEFFK